MNQEKTTFLMNRINQCPFNRENGIYAVAVEEGRSTVAVDLSPKNENIWGIPHGGLLFAIGDVAAGLAIQSVCDERTVSISGTMNYLSAGKDAKRLIGIGTVIKQGSSTAFVQAEIHNDAGITLAVGQYVMHLSRRNSDQSCEPI